MRRLLCISLFIIICPNVLVAQDSLKNQISISGGMNRMDFWSGVKYSREINQFQVFSSVEVGINRTIFQKRIFPRLTIGSSCFLFEKRNIRIGPQLSYSYSFLKVNKSTDHFHQWNEIYLGSRVEIGSKVRFTNVIVGGWMNERYFNQLTNRKVGVNSMGFYFNLGISYVW